VPSVRWECPQCGAWPETEQVSGAWRCQRCGQELTPQPAADSAPICLRCGNAELYVQKDFSHALGLGILATACGLSVVTFALDWIVTTWAILIGSALVDALLYLMVGDVVLCYRCGTQFRNISRYAGVKPFDLATAERYRREKLRRELHRPQVE